jgi:DNA-binding transcriptional regulator YiaG
VQEAATLSRCDALTNYVIKSDTGFGVFRPEQHGSPKMITATQCRSARTLLNWSLARLAAAASVSESAIDDFELERRQPDSATVGAIQRAFEDVGVEFDGDDVRLHRGAVLGQAV